MTEKINTTIRSSLLAFDLRDTGQFERVCIARFLLLLRDTNPAYEIRLNWSNLLGENLSKIQKRNLAIEFASLNIALTARC